MRSPQQRIADAYASHPDLKVAIVRVTDARYFSTDMIRKTKARLPDFEPPWRATASVVKMIIGDVSPELVAFDRKWTSCDEDTPKPRRGDEWVVYYKSESVIGMPDVVESYPLTEAREADAHLRNNGR